MLQDPPALVGGVSRVVLSVLAMVAWEGHDKFAADNFYLLSGQSYSDMSS